MTVPNIEGFTSRRRSLADEWLAPISFAHSSLVPLDVMVGIERHPTGWVTVEQLVRQGSDSDGVGCVLISMSAREAVLEDESWSGTSLGDFSIVNDDDVELGLSESLGGGTAEFFCQVQMNHRLRPPTVEVSLPFLWYWDAIRDGNDWFYVDRAGREHPLVRTVVDGEDFAVEVRALELRRYLGQRGLLAVIQHDHARWADVSRFELVQYEYESDWCKFSWHASAERHFPGPKAFSRLLGKSLLFGIQGRPVPAWLDYGNSDFPSFIIDVSDETGEPITFTCDPDKVSNYFGKNPKAPHYLTPVHFDARVLDRYLDDPERYSVSTTRLSALDMWSVSIGRTSTGDVDVYLGDLGRDIPWQELGHWRAHNIPPRGRMDEDRFRRDFLGQFAGDEEPLDSLRAAYTAVNRQFQSRFGWPLFQSLDAADALSFQRLHPPVLKDNRALVQPVLVLTKTLVDSINAKAIKAELKVQDERSIGLLEALLTSVGGNPAVARPLRNLYRLRSGGGIAHVAGESKKKLFESLGIAGLTPDDAVNKLAAELASCLREIAQQVALTT